MAETSQTPDRDALPDPAVTAAEMPLVAIVFHETTQGRVEGEEIEPGVEYLVEAPIAIANMQSGHARIVGGEEPADTAKRVAKARRAAEAEAAKPKAKS